MPRLVPLCLFFLGQLLAQDKSADVVVVGAGASGVPAAVQAARMGAKVILVSEQSHIGGSLLAVPTMDFGLFWVNNPSGVFGELLKLGIDYYARMGKSVNTPYFSADRTWAVEPHVMEKLLRQLVQAEKGIALIERSPVKSARVEKNRLLSITLADGTVISAKVFIDATMFGTLIQLSGVEAMVGNGTLKNPSGCIQDITTPVSISRYEPDQMPAILQCQELPAGYDGFRVEFLRTFRENGIDKLDAFTPFKYPASPLTHNMYRATPDSLSLGSYTAADKKPSKTGVNWANDYPSYSSYSPDPSPDKIRKLSATFLTDPNKRRADICAAKLKTWAFVCYMQRKDGLNQPLWSLSPDEFYGPPDSNGVCPGIPAEVQAYFPPDIYSREGVRIIPLNQKDIVDLYVARPPGPDFDGQWRGTPQIPAALADYGMDFHNCNAPEDLESRFGETPAGFQMYGGVFQIGLGAFIPRIDGLVPAEMNVGLSRMASSASRVQPAQMSIGQAAGALAAVAALSNVEVRQVKPHLVHTALVAQGAAISPYVYRDLSVGSEMWGAMQVSSANRVLYRYAPNFEAGAFVTKSEAAVVLSALGASEQSRTLLYDCDVSEAYPCPNGQISRQQFAISLAKALGLQPQAAAGGVSDVEDFAGAPGYINAVLKAGLMEKCDLNSQFCPSLAVNRGTAVIAYMRAMDYLAKH